MENRTETDIPASDQEEAEEFNLRLEDVLALCCGRDEKGQPNCASSVVLQKVAPDGSAETATEIPLKDTEVRIVTYRGCTVIQTNFARSSTFEYNRAYDTITKWISDPLMDDEGNTYILSLVLVPTALDGMIYAVVSSPVYATGALPEGGAGSIVMAFDTFSIQVFEDEEADMEAIENEVKAQLMREEARLDEEIATITDEYEKASRRTGFDNIYEEGVNEDLSSFADQDSESDEDENSPFRVGKERQEMRSGDGDGDDE